MEVYVLVESWQLDSGDCGETVSVFDTIEKAENEMKLAIKEAKYDFRDFETEETNFVDGDMSWSIWEKEEYCYNHIDMVIYEREVK